MSLEIIQRQIIQLVTNRKFYIDCQNLMLCGMLWNVYSLITGEKPLQKRYCRLLESGMELTRAKRQIDYVSDSGNKDWSTFLKKLGWDRIRIRLFDRKVEKDLWDFRFSGRFESRETRTHHSHVICHFTTHISSSSPSTPLSSAITPFLFHSMIETYLFHRSFLPSQTITTLAILHCAFSRPAHLCVQRSLLWAATNAIIADDLWSQWKVIIVTWTVSHFDVYVNTTQFMHAVTVTVTVTVTAAFVVRLLQLVRWRIQ